MKKNLKNNLYLFFTFLFLILFFKENENFKNCILNGCNIFIQNVFPSLFPMFIIQDLLLNYNFFAIIKLTFYPFFHKIFHMSEPALYIFILSMVSGTPTNAYLTATLVKNKNLSPKDASRVLTYSCFLNPLFLYNMLFFIFNNSYQVLKLILIHYSLNFVIALFNRNYKYEINTFQIKEKKEPFSKVVKISIERSTSIFIGILGTIIFYFILCEGINTFFKNPLLNCLTNGLLEATGGLTKLTTLNINTHLKEILASLFISFTGLSIHTQIKNILIDVSIPYKPFLISRIIHAILSTSILIIIP